jgi:hypothetical protein
MIAALVRRAGGSDLDTLAVLWEVRSAADQATAGAIDHLRAKGIPWAVLADQTGTSRQAITQWHGRAVRRFERNGSLRSEGGSR